MKTNKDLNWKKFLFRLMKILSIIVFIIGFIIFGYIIDNFYEAIIKEVLFGAILGGLYYGIRWIYRRLHGKDK